MKNAGLPIFCLNLVYEFGLLKGTRLKKRFKILFFSGEADLKGGGEFYLRDIVDGLKGCYGLSCICPLEGELACVLRKRNVKVLIASTSWNRKWFNLAINEARLCLLVARLCMDVPDVIYANAGHVNNMAVRIAKIFKIPVITHVHDVFSPPKVDKYAFGRSNQILACSSVVANLVRPFNTKVKVVNNGVDFKRFSLHLRKELTNIRYSLGWDDAFLVGFVGTLVEKKGIFDFVKVAREVAKYVPSARFVVAGISKPGEFRVLERLKEKVEEYSLGGRFFWAGFREDSEQVFAGMDVFLFPAHFEAFGRVLIESMACGAAVVSTLSGGPEEIIKDGVNGFLCNPGDVKGMTDAVVLLYKDSRLKERIVTTARQRVEKSFSISDMINQVDGVIKNVLTSIEV